MQKLCTYTYTDVHMCTLMAITMPERLKYKSGVCSYATMADKTEVKVDVRKDGEKLATVKHAEVGRMSVEVGSSFGTCMRVWFDRMGDDGGLYKDGMRVGTLRSGLRSGVRKAGEAALWQSHTGDVSALADGQDDGVAFVEVCDNE